MNKSDLIRKLTSRKLWLAVALFASGLLAAFGMETTAEKVAGLIMQGAAVIAYIVGEGLVDAANKPPDDGATEPVIEYRYLDENGVPVDGHFVLVHNVEEDVKEAQEGDHEW